MLTAFVLAGKPLALITTRNSRVALYSYAAASPTNIERGARRASGAAGVAASAIASQPSSAEIQRRPR